MIVDSPQKKKHKWGYFVVPKISYIHCISLMFPSILLYLHFYTVLILGSIINVGATHIRVVANILFLQ